VTVDSTEENLNWHLRTKTLGRLARALFPVEVIGRENIPAGEAFVFVVGPHKTQVETVLVPAYLQEIEFHIMAKDSLFRIPFFGKMFLDAGGIPVDRREGKGIAAINASIVETRRGYSVINFAEGTRHPKDKYLHVGKTGAVRIALDAGVKIIPVGLIGMRGWWPFRKRYIVIGELFDPRVELNLIQRFVAERLPTGKINRQLTDRVMQRVAALADIDYLGQDERDGRAE